MCVCMSVHACLHMCLCILVQHQILLTYQEWRPAFQTHLVYFRLFHGALQELKIRNVIMEFVMWRKLLRPGCWLGKYSRQLSM